MFKLMLVAGSVFQFFLSIRFCRRHFALLLTKPSESFSKKFPENLKSIRPYTLPYVQTD